MAEIDFMSVLHKSTERDYMARVNDKIFPKAKAAKIAKEYGQEYWDGDRRICYGGYRYIPGRFDQLAKSLVLHYKLPKKARILDVGCGKGYLLYDLMKILPEARVFGIDVSTYAIDNSKSEIKNKLKQGSATKLPWEDDYFDLVLSINTLHNLYCFELDQAIKEIERVGKNKYICVESYNNEEQKANLLYWQVTCEAFNTPEEWRWWFSNCDYTGDYSFIFFE